MCAMDYIPTDIFEDLLHDVVGKKYSGPPLAASDLKVLSGPQQIDIAKVADTERFTSRPISRPHQRCDRDFSKTSKTYSSTNKSNSVSGSSGKDVERSHSPSSRQQSCSPHKDQDQYHGHFRSSDSSSEEANHKNRDGLAEHHSASFSRKDVKPDNGAGGKDGASRTQKLHTSDTCSPAGSSHVKDGRDRCAAVLCTDSQVADPECLLMIKNLLQYSYNKWRLQNDDVVKPQFWFLFENSSEEYKYYRLKLTQLLKLKNVTVDAESQANGHGMTVGHLGDESMRKTATASKENPVKDEDFPKIKRIQTATVGTQTDLKMPMFNLSLADIIQQSPRQIPAVPELLHSQIVASQHPAPYALPTVGNAAGAFHGHKGDMKSFTSGLSLEPHSLPRQIPAPRELFHQNIIAQKMVPCPPDTTPNAPWAFQSQKHMETIKTFTTKPDVESKSSIIPQFSEIDEITKKALQNIAHLHVDSQQQNQRFDVLKGPEFWFLNEKLSPVYKYYRMKLTELRQARGLPDDIFESENIGKVCGQHSETKSANIYGLKTLDVKPLVTKKPELKGCGQQRSMTLGSVCWESEPDCSRLQEPAPDAFELLVTCSDDDDSDVVDASPPVREPALPQDDLILVTEEDPWKPLEEMDLGSEEKPVSGKAQQSLYPKALQNNWELKSQYLKPQNQLRQASLEFVRTKVSFQPTQEIKSISAESTSKEAMQSATVKQSPVSRKRGRLPKGVNVPPKRMHHVKKSTGLEHVPEEASLQSLEDTKLKPEESSAAEEPVPQSSMHQDSREPVPEKFSTHPLVEIELKPAEGPGSEEALQSISPKPLPQNCKPEPKTQELQPSRHPEGLKPVPEQVASQPAQEMESKSAESTSEEVVQSATVKQSPVSRKRGRPPKEVTVTPKRICPAEESTDLVKPGSKELEECQDIRKTKSKKETSSINDKSSLEGASEEVHSPGPEKKLYRKPGNITPTSTNDALIVSKKPVTRLKK